MSELLDYSIYPLINSCHERIPAVCALQLRPEDALRELGGCVSHRSLRHNPAGAQVGLIEYGGGGGGERLIVSEAVIVLWLLSCCDSDFCLQLYFYVSAAKRAGFVFEISTKV
jgi:hypothetical protein